MYSISSSPNIILKSKKNKIKLPSDSESDGEQRVIKDSKEKSSTTKSSQKIKKDQIKQEQLTKPNFAESTSAAENLKKKSKENSLNVDSGLWQLKFKNGEGSDVSLHPESFFL